METRTGPDLFQVPIEDEDLDEEYEDDHGYCNCNAMHDDTELGGLCSACGGIVD